MKKILAVVLVLAACVIAQTAKTKIQPSTAANASATSQVGKYQIFFSPHDRADVYLVDTETGQVWKPITISNAADTNLDNPPQVWVYQDRIDNAQQFKVWSTFHKKPIPPMPEIPKR